jgi:hypothetical protein
LDKGRWGLAAGVDSATAYFHRGFLRHEGGLILQPYATLSFPWHAFPEMQLTPYLSVWNSLNWGGRGPLLLADAHSVGHGSPLREAPDSAEDGWDETELMGGVVVGWRGFTLEGNSTRYLYRASTMADVQELGLKMAYDIRLPPRDGLSDLGELTFALKPFAGLFYEVWKQEGDLGVYFETGIEPSVRWEGGGGRFGIGLPMRVGMSLDDYYFDAQGDNAPLGYLSLGIAVSFGRPMPSERGWWYLTGSVRYLFLEADELRALNGGDDHELIGLVGMSFAF